MLIFVSGDLLISLLLNVQYSEMCRILKTSASSPWRVAQAPNSAESTAVQNSTMLVATHDWRRLGILVGSPSTDEVSLCASKPSLSSDFTGLYDSRFCVLPNILMAQMTRGCKKDNGWEKNDDEEHGGTEEQEHDFAMAPRFIFGMIRDSIEHMAKTGKPAATHHNRIRQLPRKS